MFSSDAQHSIIIQICRCFQLAVSLSQRSIGGHNHVTLLAELNQLFLIQLRRAFDLIGDWFDFGYAKQPLDLLAIEVGYTDAFYQTQFHQLFHCLPGVYVVDITIIY